MSLKNCISGTETNMWSVVTGAQPDYEKAAFKAEKRGYQPETKAEKKLVETLEEIKNKGDDQNWSARHSHDLDFGLKPEARYFNPDGTTNPSALLQKGVTTVTFSKTEVTNKDVVYLNTRGTEDEWGLVGSVSYRKFSSPRLSSLSHILTISISSLLLSHCM
jgi:hypothetical protein